MTENKRHLNEQESVEPDSSFNIMTCEAFKYLKKSLEDANNQSSESQKAIGETGGTSDWHDNFALESCK